MVAFNGCKKLDNPAACNTEVLQAAGLSNHSCPRNRNLRTPRPAQPRSTSPEARDRNLQCWRITAHHREPYPGGLACRARDLYGLGAAIVTLLNVELNLLAFCQTTEAICHNAGLQAAQETRSENTELGYAPCHRASGAATTRHRSCLSRACQHSQACWRCQGSWA